MNTPANSPVVDCHASKKTVPASVPRRHPARKPFLLLACLSCLLFVGVARLAAAPRKTEAELIKMLTSTNYSDVIDAMDRIPAWYPNSTNAIPIIQDILRNKEITERREVANDGRRTMAVVRKEIVTRTQFNLRPNVLARRAARALGNYHFMPAPEDLKVIEELLRARDPNTVMDTLKALSGMRATNAVALVVPLLKDEDHHVLRDSCRTLAVIGTKANIPAIEPLLQHSRMDVQTDAQKAIEALKAR
jgi:hypothetical protein